MKRISVRIIQSLSDYPPNMELCQVEEVVIVVCAVSVYYSVQAFFLRARKTRCVLRLIKAVAFRTLIEIISMRIEPSQPTRVLRDCCCATVWLVRQHLPLEL